MMMSDVHDTTDPRTLRDPTGPHEDGGHVPCAVLLYHGELRRIGAVTPPELLAGGERVVFGRNAPDFLEPGPVSGTFSGRKPLEDPCVSRRQVSIRWLSSLQAFEVEPSPSSRRPVFVMFRREGASRQETWRQRQLKEEVLLKPGVMLALDDRVLLWLALLPRSLFSETRLGMLGLTAAIENLREDIRDAALFERPVLILGQTGAGKELAARGIHDASPRKGGAFVSINCAAIPEHLVESVLFGYKKGAFTGATGPSKGLFVAADGGTLFLDEFGELPLPLQSKLLRVLQDGTFTPIGAHRDVTSSVRVVAATNRDPIQEVREGRLREDLFHRISAHVLTVPPLRERLEDVPVLFAHFLKVASEGHPRLDRLWRPVDASVPPVPMIFFHELMSWEWPGNARELQNIAEQTARLNLRSESFRSPSWSRAMESGLETGDLALERVATLATGETDALRVACASLGTSRDTLASLMSGAELRALETQIKGRDVAAAVDMIKAVGQARLAEFMARYAFRQRQASAALGVSRTTLLKLMESLGMPRPKDLVADAINAGIEAVGEDVDRLSSHLRVSPRGLRLRMAELRERGELA